MKRGFRVVAFAVAAALALFAVPASADDHQQSTYLALGDSFAFGFNPNVVLAGGGSNPANFPGYSDTLAGTLGLNLTNAACPGETSGSMISGMRPDNGCQDFRALFPLHTTYNGAQLAFAVKYLRSHHDTDLVTIQIGGNDVLVLVSSCRADPTCVLDGLAAVEAQMAANLSAIYLAIRHNGHYHGTIVTVPYFAFDYNDPAQVAISTSLDGVVAAVAMSYHARVADVFGAFATASAAAGGVPCAAGLQVFPNPTPPPPCDIHPSLLGHAVITKAILAVLPDDNNDNNN
jgi:lysophospholipase L1-like esterase